MACLKGAHSEVSASQALMKLLQRFIENTENWTVNLKIFIIMHRCLQDFDLSQAVAQELSEKSDILTYYKKKPSDNSYGKLISFCIKHIHSFYPSSVSMVTLYV